MLPNSTKLATEGLNINFCILNYVYLDVPWAALGLFYFTYTYMITLASTLSTRGEHVVNTWRTRGQHMANT